MIGRVAGAAALGVILAIAAAEPAAAADELQVSSDGATYSDALSSPLFAGLPLLVPNDSEAASFFVRNTGPSPAYLAVTVANPAWTDDDLADALTLGASAPGNPGKTAVLSAATDCTVLLEGYPLEAGQAVKVTMTVAIGDLAGTAGQNAIASMDARLILTETGGLPAGPACATPPTTVVVVPPTTRPGGVGVPALAKPTAAPEPAEPVEEEEEPASPIEALAIVLTNTLSSFDPVAVAFAAAAVPAGAALFMIVGRVRRRRGDFSEETP